MAGSLDRDQRTGEVRGDGERRSVSVRGSCQLSVVSCQLSVVGASVSEFVPEGRCDRSLARSAWDTAPPQKNRPVGYGAIRAGVAPPPQIGLRRHPDTSIRRNALPALLVG
jgi:hypothetical protein